MTGKENFEPLDELFRKTFRDLPDTPNASGWDVPSSRVWQRVQGQIKPAPTPGWTLQHWVLLTAAAAVVAVGLYFAFGRTQPTPTPPRIELPATPPPAAATPTEAISTPSAEKSVVKPVGKVRPTPAETRPNPAVNSSTPRGEAPNQRKAVPLPGSKPVAPNSTEREKEQGGQ